MRFESPAPAGTDADALVLGALLVVVPWLLGWTMGWALRPLVQRRRGWRRELTAVLCAIPPVAIALPVAGAAPVIGSWDVLLVCGWIALGVFVSSRHVPGRSAGLALVVVAALTLGVLEILCRLGLPELPPYPPAREARLVVSFTTRDPPCDAIFPDVTNFLAGRARDAGERLVRVVHVGDSMVWGNSVAREQAFPNVLGARDSRVAHVNSGTPAAGPDSHLLVAANWLAQAHVDLMVVYVFMGNDVHDIDRAYTCCAMGPLLAWDGAAPRPRCERASWTFPVGVLLSGSPPPYPLRVAAGWSSFAAHATAAFDALNAWILTRQLFNVNFGSWSTAPEAERFGKLERILRALREACRQQRVPLVLVVLPYRATLEGAAGHTPSARDVWESGAAGIAAHQRVVDIARALDLDVLDAWQPFADAIARDGVEQWFAHDYPGDVHFSPAGHALLAEWLAPQLDRRLRSGAADPAPPTVH